VNHTLPSGPAVIPSGWVPPGSANSVTEPNAFTRAILLGPGSVSHAYPSETATPAAAPLSPGYSNIDPVGVLVPYPLPAPWANTSVPSGNAVRPSGLVFWVGIGNSVTVGDAAAVPAD